MSDMGKELENILQELATEYDRGFGDPHAIRRARAAIERLTERSNLALLSRILEAGPRDEDLSFMYGWHDGKRKSAINSQNAKWRATINNIAKEIRGER